MNINVIEYSKDDICVVKVKQYIRKQMREHIGKYISDTLDIDVLMVDDYLDLTIMKKKE